MYWYTFHLEENLVATDMPIDTPSENMLNFMRKHYCSEAPIWQSNNFVVFPLFFAHAEKFMKPRRMRSATPCARSPPLARPSQGSLTMRELPVKPAVCSTDSAVQVTPQVTNIQLPGAIERTSNSLSKTDSTKPPVEDPTPTRFLPSVKVGNDAMEKMPPPGVSKRESNKLSSSDQSSSNSVRLVPLVSACIKYLLKCFSRRVCVVQYFRVFVGLP
ncbi:unnamed protein product [Dibothriocephalus latus]|uniref:N-acetyltransferase domain-containing protein n=1 Tax=Dibothriocephalus latus TaxID=60516 RepID=A0A3P7LZF7_DIBLA|nr:unnamed protein product [Dibothriocephalus latus]